MKKTDVIYKIGAIIFDDQHRLLAVHKKGKPKLELIMPGGRMEDGEDDETTLRREIIEELNAEIKSYKFYGEFQAKAIYEDKWLVMRTYLVTLASHPQPANEIDELVWLDQHYQNSGYHYASILGKQILPRIFFRSHTPTT